MHILAHVKRWQAFLDGIASTLIAVISMVRGLLLFLSGRPKTPLRVLCIVAFDTLHVLSHKRRLPTLKLKMLATMLDFGAYANAALDQKKLCPHECRLTRQLLDEAGIGWTVAKYLRRLGYLETSRPRPGGDCRQFQKVSLYREAVVRLSLGMLGTIARGNQCLDESIAATYDEGDLNLLFRIAMQCQIIDDVLDYSQDRSTGLPSFLTACKSHLLALELTQQAARGYGEDRPIARADNVFPLRAALFLVSMCAKLVLLSERTRPSQRKAIDFAAEYCRMRSLDAQNKLDEKPPSTGMAAPVT
jgi:hypothetical protein